MILTVFVLLSVLSSVSANHAVVTLNGNPGNIWTTTGSCGPKSQSENHYVTGNIIYINGKGLLNNGRYNWTITGNSGSSSCDPKIIVATGLNRVDDTGNVCIEAYTINSNDCGEYKVAFGTKDNSYRVDTTPTVPEFGLIAGITTVLGALGMFFVVRKK